MLPRPTPIRVFLALLAAVLLCGAALFVDTREAEEALLDRRYGEAAAGIEGLLARAEGPERERLLFLLGRSRLLSGDGAGAVAALERLLKEHPKSRWADQAAFAQAEAYAQRRDYRRAAEVLAAKVGLLVSEARKEQVAAVYLRLAEKALGGDRPDHRKARTFYDLASDLGLRGKRAEQVAYLAALESMALKDWRDGARRFGAWIKRWPGSDRLARARYQYGEALRRSGRTLEARQALREVEREHPGTEASVLALRALAASYGLPKPRTGNDLAQGVAALRRLIAAQGKHKLAPVSALEMAQAWSYRGRHEEALAEAEGLIGRWGDAGVKEVAEARALKGDILRRQGRYGEAVKAYRAYLSAHPDHGKWRQVQAAVVECAYEEALGVQRRGKKHYDEAIGLLRAFVKAHPLDRRNAAIVLRIGKMEMDRKRWASAKRVLGEVVSRYPRTTEAGESQYRIGEIQEKRLNDPAGAIETWKKLTWSSWTRPARQMVKKLRDKSLSVYTKRIYRTDEQARFTVESRNIEKVRVRVFRLDLATYFKATHTASSVEQLQIEVIEPDRTFESGVEGYRPFVETSREVKVPFKGPGAYVVKVDDRKREATTLVLVSDLALIVKSSRSGLFVFAENTLQNAPQGEAQVIVSDGKRIVAEGRTGADGVWRWEDKKLLTLNELRVFALAAGGSGAGTLRLRGLGALRGLEAKGFVSTDRPAYRPGQKVRVKAVLRDVDAGVYTLPKIKKYRLTLLDSRGAVIQAKRATTNDFGTLACDFDLPEQARLGRWVVQVRQDVPAGKTYRSTLRVARYRVPKVRCEILPESTVVMRGEKIQGKVRLTWFYGEPVAGEPVNVVMHLPGGTLRHGGETDATGCLPFTFETRDFSGEGTATLMATAPGRAAQAGRRVLVAAVAMTPAVELVREVYLQGETVEARVTAKDRLGKPLAAKLTVKLVRKVKGPDGRLGEVEAGRVAVTTDGVAGAAKAAFKLTAGGSHLVRVEGEDRFGNPVSGEAALFCSDKEDRIKLRLLTGRERWKVGETAAVRVVNRAKPRLALFTTEAAGVMQWWSKVVPAGESRFELPLERRHAPNFRLALAMVDGNRFHRASRDLVVTQGLALDLTVEREPGKRADTVGPRDNIGIRVSAKDTAGRPVEAELAVAVVDEALLNLFPATWRRIQDFFYGARREVALRTSTSCTFSYKGVTRKVSEDLLQEENRAREKQALERLLKESVRTRAARKPRLGFFSADKKAPSKKRLKRMEMKAEAELAEDEEVMDEPMEADSFNDVLGVGGGAGGFGGRFGGRASRRRTRNARSEDVREAFPEVALWRPTVVTDAQGGAWVPFGTPDNLTTWKVRVRGVTGNTLVGQEETSFAVRKPLLIDLALPLRMVEGDTLRPVAEVRNLTGEEQAVHVTVRSGAGKVLLAREAVKVAAGAVVELPFTLAAARIGDLSLQAEVRSRDHADATRAKVEVLPLGSRLVAAAAGVERGNREVKLTLPAGQKWHSRSLVIALGARVDMALVGAALRSPHAHFGCRVHSTLDRICTGLGALAALELAGGGAPAEGAQVAALRRLIESTLAEVATGAQGGWAWNKGAQPDLISTCLAARFLAGARKAGFTVPDRIWNGARSGLSSWYARLSDHNQRARVLEALALVGGARLEWLTSLRRRAGSLDAEGLSCLLSAFALTGRPTAGQHLVPALRASVQLSGPGQGMANWAPDAKWRQRRLAPYLFDQVEITALAVRALLLVDPGDPVAAKGARWLLSRRRHGRWSSPRGHAAALEALCLMEGKAARERSEGVVRITVNEKVVGRVALREGRPFRVAVPASMLLPEENRIAFALDGRGRYTWRARLEGLTVGVVKRLRNQHVKVDRTVLAPSRTYKGRSLKAGFGMVTGSYKPFENTATEVAVGGTVKVRLRIRPGRTGTRGWGHLAIVEQLPAGCAVVPGSIQGPVQTSREGDGTLLLYVGQRWGWVTVTYELSGFVPGAFKALPARVFPVESPERVSESGVTDLKVLPRGGKGKDAYRLTPDEIYNLGLALYADREYKRASALLGDLVEKWTLRRTPLRKVARALLDMASRVGAPKQVVAAFELLREAWPTVELPFEQVMQVGRSYRSLGEFERARQVFLAVAEASFMKEVRVGGTLEKQNEHLEAVDYVLGLYYAYPPLPVIRQSYLAVGQELARKAEGLAPGQRLGEGGPGRQKLLTRALAVLREFLVLHPEDRQAPEATFALASGRMGLKDWGGALAWAASGVRRYGRSRWLDELLYLKGYAHFAQGKYAEALADLERVAGEDFPTDSGVLRPSESKWLALFLMGQIHHALGRRGLAEKYYEEVKGRFADAAQNLAFITEKWIALPEVTTVKPGAKAVVELTWRNLEKTQLRLYRVDLLRLYVLQKSLAGIRGVQLSGIKPHKQLAIDLGGHPFLEEGRRKVELPVDKPGAYLVIAQSKDHVATGLVLRTGLELKVQEDSRTGRVGVHVFRGTKPVSGAYVKITGSGDGRFRSGETDLRGIYAATGVVGKATVLVKAGDSYAFHRGERPLLAARPRRDRQQRLNAPATEMLQNMRGDNSALQRRARGQLDKLFDNRWKGVNLKQIKGK